MRIDKAIVMGAIAASATCSKGASQGGRAAVTEAEVLFSSGGHTLCGTLHLPRKQDKVPGIVIIHGSGESDRSNPWTRAYAESLSQRGIAVLHPDKRGCGKSGGNWRTADIFDLADDALAAVEVLHRDERVSSTHIGLIGFSQGGHVAPAAASRSSSVAFVIDVSGSVVPMAEQMTDEVEMSAERAGLTPAQTRLVAGIHALGLRFVRSGGDADWNEYVSALARAREGELKGNAVLERFPSARDHPALAQVQSIVRYDPMDHWRKLTVPSLFVFGGNDTRIRVGKSLERLRIELPSDKFNYSILYFSRNGHALHREDAMEFMARWIVENGVF